MKKLVLSALSIAAFVLVGVILFNNEEDQKTEQDKRQQVVERKVINPTQKGEKKTPEERALFDEARLLYEYNRQVNPQTGEIPLDQKVLERDMSKRIVERGAQSRAVMTTYESRGPSNLGGRTRALVVDISDNTGNTMIAGGISGGVFRTIDGGANWTKVSANNEIHNVTAIAQDPRPGFQNVWYYGTGESLGNSASVGGAFYFGQGIWQSTDSGLTWTQIAGSSSSQEAFDSLFDFVHSLAVNPTNGELLVAHLGTISRYNGSTFTTELQDPGTNNTSFLTDVVVTDTGRVYAALTGSGSASVAGVWTSPTGNGSWTRIAEGTTPSPAGWSATGRIVLGLAPSNQNILYALYNNGVSNTETVPAIEADLWRYDQSTTTWTNYSSKLPDEPDLPYIPSTGQNASQGNDPFSIQGGYDLIVKVKPDDQDFVVIGGTNAYKIEDIVNDATFTRIGGYASPDGYALYSVGGVDHHPDIHALAFNPFNTSQLLSGTDGGVHRTNDIGAASVAWTNLNNDYQTYQYYHVGIDPLSGSDGVIGGAQDNGTTIGGTVFGQPDTDSMDFYFGGDGVAAEISRDDACTPLFFGAQNGFLVRNCVADNPSFFGQLIAPTGSQSEFVTYFHLDPDNNNALYYAGRNTLYRTTTSSTVASGTWDNMGTTGSIGTGTADWFQRFATSRGAYSPATSYLLMGGDEGGIFRLDDPQNAASLASAVNITPPTASTAYPTVCSGLAIHPTNPDIVMVTYTNYGVNSIYVTSNATSATPTWTLVERNLAAFSIRSAAITEANGETLYFVGTARGLYSSPDPTTTDWTIEAPNQIGFALISSLRYRPSDNKLLIGTHGNGMYMATISEVLSTELFEGKGNLSLYPNPATTNINFNLQSSLITEAGFSIYDLMGKVVKTGKVSENESIDVTTLKTGLYLVELDYDGKKSSGKFIKN